MATHGEIRWPPAGTFDGRLRGDSHGRRHFLSVLQDNPEPPAEGSGSAKRRAYEVGGLIVRSNFVALFWIR